MTTIVREQFSRQVGTEMLARSISSDTEAGTRSNDAFPRAFTPSQFWGAKDAVLTQFVTS